MITILLFISAFFYLVSIITVRYRRHIMISSFATHTLTIIFVITHGDGFPIANLSSSILLFTWAMVLLWMAVSIRYKVVLLGRFTALLTLLFLLIALFLPERVNPIIQSNWFVIHSSISIFGFAGFAFAFIAGIVYLIMEKGIKSRQPRNFSDDLSSIEVLELVGYRALGFGFLFFTLGIACGALWLKSVKGIYWNFDPKLMWTLITWLLYAGLLHVRFTATWRGRKVAILYIIGFIFVVFTFVGTNYLFPTFHSF